LIFKRARNLVPCAVQSGAELSVVMDWRACGNVRIAWLLPRRWQTHVIQQDFPGYYFAGGRPRQVYAMPWPTSRGDGAAYLALPRAKLDAGIA